MRVAVLGGGNGSFAAVADATVAGHDVRWWRRELAAFGSLATGKPLTLIDSDGIREIPISPTDDLAAAIEGAELIIAPTPAFAHEALADALAAHLVDGQVIYLSPGSFGSFLMMKRLREQGCVADISIAETGTLPWLCRKQGDDTVRITTRATRLPTGVLPERLADHALRVIGQAFPGAIEPCGDALSGALMNAGPIIHPPLILMNAGPIEHFDHWDIHNEGTQPAVRAVHTALDAERMAVREALGYGAPHFPLADYYEGGDWMYGTKARNNLVDSGDWSEKLNFQQHRYMTEDTAVGLAFLVSVGEWAGVPVPVAAGLLSIAGAVHGRDLRATGRTLENLGLADQSVTEVQTMLRAGI
ncbi:NAD/NADP-dependent octopine/nopaline dehydrogenase family protein [Cryobacterium sp. PH29-G1]|uniref:NAD/NADP-dependent octopine/nopaline dehydrogenase family protein n=1 Tax=Cryobacterium sp. PH29-G1 TaxID=3046211 RepID=UPI0024BA60A8|nr:NAD/NADP-dependent octopine/nopaline dehydrogenase family protein [Cryobacterium sp. PH29-G1]MDJ0347930.1 NAD/NADP octopine/nopaline dehydrogenase family protein [Cryobacterium sp. PH29-G1]